MGVVIGCLRVFSFWVHRGMSAESERLIRLRSYQFSCATGLGTNTYTDQTFS